MNGEEQHQRLSKIPTMWAVLREAHDGPPEKAEAARQLLVQRYGKAVHRYLQGALGNSHAADDLFQEFVLSLIRGDFHGADPQRGRFRNYVKGVLFNLVNKYRKMEHRRQGLLAAGGPEPANTTSEDLDREYTEKWREALLARAWDALAQAHPVFHTVLRFRAEHHDWSSRDMAEQLGQLTGKSMTADAARQVLHRARDKFAQLLLEEVAESLESPTLEDVHDELADLGLLTYCQSVLSRYTI